MKDKEVRGFSDTAEMHCFVETQENNSQWKTGIDIKDVSFMSIPKDVAASTSEEWKETAETGTKLWILIDGKPFPIRDCAMQSVYDRTGTKCQFVASLPPERRAEILTEACQYVDISARWGYDGNKPARKGQVLIADNKVSAFLSDNETKIDYLRQDTSEIFDLVDQTVRDLGVVKSFRGYYSYEGIDATWRSEMTINLSNKEGNSSPFNVDFRLSTSDIGKGSVHLSTKLTDGICIVPVGDARLPHRKQTERQDIDDAVDQLLKQVDVSKKTFDELKTQIVQYPEQCMKKMIRELELPQKAGVLVLNNYLHKFGDAPANAYTLFLVLCEINEVLLENSADKFDYRNKQEVKILKALSKTMWKKYDKPYF